MMNVDGTGGGEGYFYDNDDECGGYGNGEFSEGGDGDGRGFGYFDGGGTGRGRDQGYATKLLASRPDSMGFYICQMHTLGGWR